MEENENWELFKTEDPEETLENKEEKRVKKQKIIRDEFEKIGKYEMPLIRKQEINVEKIEPWRFTKTKPNDIENTHKSIHFFTYDWLFESVYANAEKAMEKLDQYYALFTPDFSLHPNMPIALQIYNTFKSRWCGAYWQSQGKRVIATMNWSSPDSYDFCFDGVEEGSVVAVSTYYAEDSEELFMPGYEKMLEVVKPSAILCYGEPFRKMKGNVVALSPYDHEMLIKQLGFKEFARRFMEGSLYPSN